MGNAGRSGRAAVALSGGVDSSVAAALLQRDGWDVVGVTLVLNAARPGLRDLDIAESAARAAGQLGIEHHVIDRAADFEAMVLRPAWGDLLAGRTPNPCILCNERIKFGAMLDWALKNGCAALATGHYVRTRLEGGQVRLLRGVDRAKDQTYFLAGLGQGQLSRIMFPLGEMGKPAVKKMAAEMGLASYGSKESQDTCFRLPGLTLAESLRARFQDGAATQAPGGDGAGSQAAAPATQAGQAAAPATQAGQAAAPATQAGQAPGGNGGSPRPSFIVDWEGRRLAAHGGMHNFTIGQRRGVGVGTGGKAWVCRLDPETGDVHITNSEDRLLCDEIRVAGLSWVSPGLPEAPLERPIECEVQVRYRSAPVAATLVSVAGGECRVALHAPARAVAPGQAAVFYRGDAVLGRGWIVGTRTRD